MIEFIRRSDGKKFWEVSQYVFQHNGYRGEIAIGDFYNGISFSGMQRTEVISREAVIDALMTGEFVINPWQQLKLI